MNTRRLFVTFTFVGALFMLFAAAACGDDSEGDDTDFTEPDIRGSVTTKTGGAGDTLGALLIEGDIEPDTAYDKASVRADGDTDIFRMAGGEPVEATWVDLAEGQTVEAWFEGPVAESYPVQAYAGRILLLE